MPTSLRRWRPTASSDRDGHGAGRRDGATLGQVSWFDRFRRRAEKPGGPGPSAQAQARLREFLTSREGVEAFVEPPTSVYAMTLCVVAGDGEYLRQPIKD